MLHSGGKVPDCELLVAVRALRRASFGQCVSILFVQSRLRAVRIQNITDVLNLALHLRHPSQHTIQPVSDTENRKRQQQPAYDKYNSEEHCKNAQGQEKARTQGFYSFMKFHYAVT